MCKVMSSATTVSSDNLQPCFYQTHVHMRSNHWVGMSVYERFSDTRVEDPSCSNMTLQVEPVSTHESVLPLVM